MSRKRPAFGFAQRIECRHCGCSNIVSVDPLGAVKVHAIGEQRSRGPMHNYHDEEARERESLYWARRVLAGDDPW